MNLSEFPGIQTFFKDFLEAISLLNQQSPIPGPLSLQARVTGRSQNIRGWNFYVNHPASGGHDRDEMELICLVSAATELFLSR